MRVAAGMVALWLSGGAARADPGDMYPGSHMWAGGGWLGWLAGPIMMVLVLGVLVGVVVLLVRWLGGPAQGSAPAAPPAPPARTPVEILEERYARGEIDEEELERRRRVLEKRPAQS